MAFTIKREIVEIAIKVALITLVFILSNALTIKLVYSIVWIFLALVISKIFLEFVVPSTSNSENI